jgi:diguanylate cyclase (GGDEF)-like protein
LKTSKFFLVSFIVVFVLFLSVISYIYFLEITKENLLQSKYKEDALSLQNSVKSKIYEKEQTTYALAITLAKQDNKLAKYVAEDKVPNNYFTALIAQYKNNTPYKNIWIQILDKHGISLYRSWSRKKGDNLSLIGLNIAKIVKSQKHSSTINAGKFDVSIKSIIPLYFENKFVGAVEVISHFNSIAESLKKDGVDSIVLADKKYKEQLTHPFTKLFIDDYYVANFNAKSNLMRYLQEHGVENYLKNSYKAENGYLITSYNLKTDGSTIGSYIMFKKLDKIASRDIDEFMFKWLVFGILALMVIAGVINIFMYFTLRKQKVYYKNIIDSSENIVLINDKKTMLEVNRAFFKYFNRCKTLDEFKNKYACICEFFVDEEGYLRKEKECYSWIEYVLKNPDISHKVKIDYFGNIYYFLVNISLISEEENHYAVVFSDITQEEEQRKKLEKISVTDALTGIYNRRYYMQTIEHEMHNAKRYNYPLSIMMMDIDFFKQVNDMHGHNVGDEVLREYAKFIKLHLREGDTFCRVGGEEFIVILPHTKVQEAQKVAEKLRVEIEAYKKIVPVTMSFGVTQYIQGESEDFMYKRADDALYEAKKSGRNRVVVL